MQARAVMEGGERKRCHDRAKIGATDADIDHIGDRLAGGALHLAGADPVCKGTHGVEYAVDVRHDVAAVHHDRAVRAVAQGCVENGAAFGEVDRRARKHFVALLGNTRDRDELLKLIKNLVIHGAFGIIHQQVVERGGKTAEALRIGGKGGAQVFGMGGGDRARQRVDDGLHRNVPGSTMNAGDLISDLRRDQDEGETEASPNLNRFIFRLATRAAGSCRHWFSAARCGTRYSAAACNW